jgi:hypothetical protein
MSPGVPLELADSGWKLIAKHVKLTKDGARVTYQEPFGGPCAVLTPQQIEACEFGNRPKEPGQGVVLQGKYECAAAAMAMLTGHTLFQVKRAMGRAGWRNDNRGASFRVCRAAAQALGFELIYLNKKGVYELLEEMPPALITVPSLNIKGAAHAVTWTGEEILDPNLGYIGRKTYGPEWAPWTVGATGAEVLLRPMSKIDYQDLRTVLMRGEPKEVRRAILESAA